MNRDGYSHYTMFKKTVGHDFTMMLVKDSLGHVFGVYLTDKIRNRSRYTGDADHSHLDLIFYSGLSAQMNRFN